MGFNTAPIPNQTVNKPDYKSLLDAHKRDVMMAINCHKLATVQSFNGISQTITAKINYQKTFLKKAKNGVGYSAVQIDYPILIDVPIYILSGGPAGLTFPIGPGDTCTIEFDDRDIDNWILTGQTGPLASMALHDFSHGIALVGVRSKKNPIIGYDMIRAKLFNGTTMVGVGPHQVKIANAITSLGIQLDALLDPATGLGGLCTQLAGAFSALGQAPTSAVCTAMATKIAAIKLLLDGLLE